MTLKSYLRMLLAAVTLLFVTTGCNDDDDKVGPPPSYSFSVAVSDVAQTEATITVTPSDDQATYYYAAVKKAEFDTFESDAAYAQHILDNLQAIADKKVLSLSEYLATALVKGSTPQKITDLTAGTDYYAVALGMLTDGRFTSDLVKEAFKTDDAPEPALELSITMTPGYNGEGTDTQMSVNFKASGRPAVSGKYLLASTAAIDAIIAKGGSYDDIIDNEQNGYTFASDELVELNSEEGTVGENWVWGKLTPGTSYTAIAKVKDAEGNSVLKTAVESTAAAQGGGDGPEVHLTMKAGDSKGANKTTNITAIVQCSTAVSASYWLSTTAAVEKLLGEGQTYESLASPNKDGSNVFSADWIEKTKSEDGIALNYDKCNPGESWTMIVKVTDANGKSTIEHAAVTTETAQGGGDGPELTLTMKAGDHTGADPTTKITCLIKSSGVVSAKAGLWTKAAIDDAINNQGLTIEQIINSEQNGEAIEDEYMTGINGAGLNYTWGGASPATEYTAIIKVTDAAGNSTIKSATGATESAGEGSDAYKAWLGTWTVTSTSSEVNKAPVSFDVVIGQNVANSSYSVTGWSVTAVREVLPVNAVFDAETGRMGILNEQEMTTVTIDGVDYMVTYISRCLSAGRYTYVFGDYAGLIGELDAGKSKATVVGNTLQLQGGGEAAVHSMEFFGFEVNDGDGMIRYNPADGYTDGDYPIGPYTMTKKSSSSALPASKSAVHNASLMDAAKLSSVLSSRTAVAVTSPEQNGVVFESQVAMPSSLVFDRPSAIYKATIGNVENIEKSLGLKKHFIKK